MKHTGKRILSLVLSLCLLTGLSATAFAADAPWAADAAAALNKVYGSGGTDPFSADDGDMTEGDAFTLLSGVHLDTGDLANNSTPLTRAKACAVLATAFKLPVVEKTGIQYSPFSPECGGKNFRRFHHAPRQKPLQANATCTEQVASYFYAFESIITT